MVGFTFVLPVAVQQVGSVVRISEGVGVSPDIGDIGNAVWIVATVPVTVAFDHGIFGSEGVEISGGNIAVRDAEVPGFTGKTAIDRRAVIGIVERVGPGPFQLALGIGLGKPITIIFGDGERTGCFGKIGGVDVTCRNIEAPCRTAWFVVTANLLVEEVV